MDLIFMFDRPRALIEGTMTRPVTITQSGSVDSIGVRFRPGLARGFLRSESDALTDHITDLSGLWGPPADRLLQRLTETPSATDRIQLIEHALLNRLQEVDPMSASIEWLVRNMANCTEPSRLSRLARRTGWSERHLRRTFHRHVGVGPKFLDRVIRFRKTLRRIGGNPKQDKAALAVEMGYCDQAHMNNEFRRFTGMSPTRFLTTPYPHDSMGAYL